MLDIADTLNAWHSAGRPYGIATVVAVRGSAPRGNGAALAVDLDGTAVGGVSGGCVEAAVYELCREILQHGTPWLASFGYAEDDAFEPGLTCGGEIDVFIQPVHPGDDRTTAVGVALTALACGEPVALARIIAGPAALLGGSIALRAANGPAKHDGWTSAGTVGDARIDRAVTRRARAMADGGITGSFVIGSDADGPGEACGDAVTVFVESYVPAPRMIVFGAVDFAAALAKAGKFLGYHVTVCDARPVFTTSARFPDADEVVVAWPHRYLATTPTDRRTVLAVLTHDAKFDVPLLVEALRMPVAYVGAMGSRQTCTLRETQLRAAGLGDDELARLHAPIGLDLGAQTSEETALSIAAEIVASRHNGTGLPLAAVSTAIHRPDSAATP